MNLEETFPNSANRDKIINLLKAEGLMTTEQIAQLHFSRRAICNPQGLNEIIHDVSGVSVGNDDWDKSFPKNMHMGRLTDKQAKGKKNQMWGMMLQRQAFLYLKEKLKDNGWKLKEGHLIDEEEYDCVGWYRKKVDVNNLDLAIEMYFPLPQKEEKYEFQYIVEKTRRMREKLKKVNARYKYLLIGVPQNKRIEWTEISHSDMKLVLQRHKFGQLKTVKQTKLKFEY